MATRDLPKSVGDFAFGWTKRLADEIPGNTTQDHTTDLYGEDESEKKSPSKTYGQPSVVGLVSSQMVMLTTLSVL